MNLVRSTIWLATMAVMLVATSSDSFAQRDRKERGNREERPSAPSEPRAPRIEPPRAPRPEPDRTPRIEAPRAPRIEPIRTPRPEPVRTPRVEPVRTPRPEPVRTPRVEPVRTPRPEPIRTPRSNGGNSDEQPARTPRVEPIRTPRPEPIRTPRVEPVRTPRAEPDRPQRVREVPSRTPAPIRSVEGDNGDSNTGSSNRGNRNPVNSERPERTPRVTPRPGVEDVVDTPRNLPRTPRVTPPEGGRNPVNGNRGDSELEAVQRRLDQLQRNPRNRPGKTDPEPNPAMTEGDVDTPPIRGDRPERPERTPPVRNRPERNPTDATPPEPMPDVPALDGVNDNQPRRNRPDRTPGDRTPDENTAGDNEPSRRPGGRLRDGEEVLPPAERPDRGDRPGRGENRDNRGDNTPDQNPEVVVEDKPNKTDKPNRQERVPVTRLPGNRLPDNEVVVLPENRVDKETRAVIDRLDRQAERLRVPVNLARNGQLRDIKLDDQLTQQLRRLERVRNADELTDQLRALRIGDQRQLRDLRLDRNSGFFQARLIDNDFRDLQRSRLGRRIELDRQFEFYRRGDVARRLGLFNGIGLVRGWNNRPFRGPIYRDFTRASFSFWYAGPGFYPRYSWLPRWSRWVDWSWWNNAGPLYDPRPIYCRPVIYEPAPVWTYYEYPTWQSLPEVAAGTWVDLPEYAPVPEPDLRLTAVRFVDGGHPDQDLGPRFRVWVQNSSSQDWNGDFSVLLLAANDELPQAELLQAGVTMTQLAAGEIQSVDIRLPIEVSEMQPTEDGQLGPFEFLHVLVDANGQVPEQNETNNGTVIARADVPPVDPAIFSTDSQAAAAGALVTLAGEGFGPEPGQVILLVNGREYDTEIYGWYDLGVRFAVPAVPGPVDSAEILVIRGDGAASNPISLDLVEASQFDQAPVILK